jgi:hypothetical protein
MQVHESITVGLVLPVTKTEGSKTGDRTRCQHKIFLFFVTQVTRGASLTHKALKLMGDAA